MAGNVYVADPQVQEVLVFDADGTFARRLGRAGRGPGKLMWVFGHLISVELAWQSPDRLWVTDQPLLQLLDTAGSFIAAVPARTLSFGRFGMPPQVDTMGFAYFGVSLPGNHGTDFVVRYGVSGSDTSRLVALDSLRLDQLASTARLESEASDDPGVVRSMTELPMEPRIVWAIGPTGNVWLASTSTYRLHEVALTGDTLRTIELGREPERLGQAERNSLAEASGFDVSQIPVFRPLFNRLDVASDGAVWVRTPAPESAWDVFDACGRYLGSVSAETKPIREPFVVAGGGALIGVVTDDFDLEYVVRIQLSRRDGSPFRPASEC